MIILLYGYQEHKTLRKIQGKLNFHPTVQQQHSAYHVVYTLNDVGTLYYAPNYTTRDIALVLMTKADIWHRAHHISP